MYFLALSRCFINSFSYWLDISSEYIFSELFNDEFVVAKFFVTGNPINILSLLTLLQVHFNLYYYNSYFRVATWFLYIFNSFINFSYLSLHIFIIYSLNTFNASYFSCSYNRCIYFRINISVCSFSCVKHSNNYINVSLGLMIVLVIMLRSAVEF